MRREDMELENILRNYNSEQRQGSSRQNVLEKELDTPFYKGVQLPMHLKWVTIGAVSSFIFRK